MAKGSVRKKGKKWYYHFYVEDAGGNLVQKEFTGTESKSETEKLLRQAMEDYEEKKFIAKADNITLGELLDIWAEEELKVGTLSNGTVENYFRRDLSRRESQKRIKQRLYPLFLSGFTAVVPFCGIPKATDYVQSNAVHQAETKGRGSGFVFRGRYGTVKHAAYFP